MACFLSVALILASLISQIHAKDCGVHGKTYPIEEEDLIDYIQRQIHSLGDKKLDAIQHQVQDQYKETLIQPKPVEGISEAHHYQMHFFDPATVVKKSIKDHEGNEVVREGMKYNPLNHLSLTQDLLFFDGDNLAHVEWAKSCGLATKWVLVKGSPLELETSEKRPIFFDQYGWLCKKLSIECVPCQVSQSGLRLKIEYFPMERS